MSYASLQKGLGLRKGFAFDTNLSFVHHQADLQHWSHELSHANQDYDVFPKNSSNFQRIQNIDNANQALIAIVAPPGHPCFISNSILLLAQEYP
jgi:hypothetical protein